MRLLYNQGGEQALINYRLVHTNENQNTKSIPLNRKIPKLKKCIRELNIPSIDLKNDCVRQIYIEKKITCIMCNTSGIIIEKCTSCHYRSTISSNKTTLTAQNRAKAMYKNCLPNSENDKLFRPFNICWACNGLQVN